jgi:hypothetical protein
MARPKSDARLWIFSSVGWERPKVLMDDYARYYYSITSGHSWAPGLVTVPNSSQLAMNASVPAQETAPGTATTGSMPPRPLPYPPSYDYLPPGRPPAPPPRPPSYAPSYTGGAMYPSWGPVRPSQPPGYPPYYPPYSRPPYVVFAHSVLCSHFQFNDCVRFRAFEGGFLCLRAVLKGICDASF